MLKKICASNKIKDDVYHEENQYLNLINDILKDGDEFIGRNGRTLSIFGGVMHFDLSNNTMPILTTKKLAYKTCLKELLWFIRGSTNNEELKTQDVHIWDGNSSREFLDSRGLTEHKEGDLGPIYGFQWRHFNAKYKDCSSNYENQGIDQLEYIIKALKNPETRNDRRLIMTAWNPCQLNQMALPPCHILCQFNVTKNKYLSCSLYQRSGDVGLGVPFNIASYSYLTHLIAHHCDLEPLEFIYNLGNTHIYEDHIDGLKEQIDKVAYEFPKILIKNKYDNINDYKIEDFEINDYIFHKNIKLSMVV
tara:strand:+ start:5133 stop:6050 length:918 start_codon:yes stop_codon:yes gene_type:complete